MAKRPSTAPKESTAADLTAHYDALRADFDALVKRVTASEAAMAKVLGLESRVEEIVGVIVTKAIQDQAAGPYSPGTVDERLTALEKGTGINPPATSGNEPSRTVLARLDALERRPAGDPQIGG